MPRPKSSIPAYLLHQRTNQVRVRINGRDFYLGPYGSDESRRKYGELIAKFSYGQRIDPLAKPSQKTDDDPGPSVAELWLAFLEHAKQHYTKNGKPTAELDCFKSAMKPVIELYGLFPISEFGPMQLKAARTAMVAKGWTRTYCNKSVGRVRRVFKWGIENDMVEPVTLERLKAVAPLLAGKTDAPDRPKREAVPMANIEAVKAIVKPLVADLISLQLATGARPGELLMLTTEMIDRGGEIWTATLADHKTVGYGKTRRLHFGPNAQLILNKYFKSDPSAKLFKIARSHYGNCVVAACDGLGLPRFSPHWLRHNVTTEVRDRFGIESAQALAGHSKPDTTANYARRMDKLAANVAAIIG